MIRRNFKLMVFLTSGLVVTSAFCDELTSKVEQKVKCVNESKKLILESDEVVSGDDLARVYHKNQLILETPDIYSKAGFIEIADFEAVHFMDTSFARIDKLTLSAVLRLEEINNGIPVKLQCQSLYLNGKI